MSSPAIILDDTVDEIECSFGSRQVLTPRERTGVVIGSFDVSDRFSLTLFSTGSNSQEHRKFTNPKIKARNQDGILRTKLKRHFARMLFSLVSFIEPLPESSGFLVDSICFGSNKVEDLAVKGEGHAIPQEGPEPPKTSKLDSRRSYAMDVDMEINTDGENSFSSSDDAWDDHTSCGFKCNICLELADQDPTPQCLACTTVITEKKLIPIYGIESDRRSPSVPPGFKIPNRPSPSSSSSNRQSVRQIRNAVASAFSAPFSSSSIGRAVRKTLNAIASALNANHFSKVFEFMPMVLGGIRVVVLVGGYIWCNWSWILSNKRVILWKEYVGL
ncbi:hypothetical protein ACE6H2_027101 [Prunus campanulata]